MLLIGYLVLAFKAWMLVDAVRRRAPTLWYFIVALPAGDLVYFFAVKLRDFKNVRPHAPDAIVRPSIEELEQCAAESPSFQNRARLAWTLYEDGHSDRARDLFKLALGTHPKDNEAAYGLGLCELEQGDFTAATATLSALIDRNFAYRDYAAAEAFAEALLRAQQVDEACALHEEISRATRRIDHRVAQAKILIRCKKRDHARDVLEHAISDFEAQEAYERRREGAVATEARRLLRML